MDFLGADIYALITGSSRGFGKSIASAFLSCVLTHSPRSVTLTLHGTPASRDRLANLRNELMLKHQSQHTKLTMNIFLENFENLLVSTAVSAMSTPQTPTHAFLFNNSAVLIPSLVKSMDMNDLQKTMSVNFTAMCILSQAFINTFKTPTTRHIIHTTSLTAQEPFSSWGAMGCSKAAAEMLHRVIAHENPEIRVLQYFPGEMPTDMFNQTISDSRCDASIADALVKKRRDNLLVSPEASAAKLMTMLLADDFNSGDRINFYEI